MGTWHALFGKNEDPLLWQMAVRAVISFIATLILLRAGGSRILGSRSGFDAIIMIMMGSVLARGIVGASSLINTILSAAVMIGVHRFLGWCCFRYPALENLVKGKKHTLYKNKRINEANLQKASLTRKDLEQSTRLELQSENLDEVDAAYIETNGRISFVRKKTNEKQGHEDF